MVQDHTTKPKSRNSFLDSVHYKIRNITYTFVKYLRTTYERNILKKDRVRKIFMFLQKMIVL